MSAAPFPEPGEPDGSGLPGDEGLQQGLYVTLPAEELTLEGFAEGGRADTMAPGALLSMILGVAAGEHGAGLPQLSDDQLLGLLSGLQRMESWNAWLKMAVTKEFASRPRRKDFAADEISAGFNLSWMAVAGDIAYANAVARRLPKCFAALEAGKLRPFDLKIIEDATSILSDEDAAKVDAELAGAAQGKTFGELRACVSKLVLKLDPEAVRKRKEMARRDTSVRRFREESGNAGISGREMPSVEVLASMQHVENRARQLQEAGVPGTWEELKVRAFLDLLQGRDSRLMLGEQPEDNGAPDGRGGGHGPEGSTMAPDNGVGPDDDDPGDDDPGDGGPGDDDPGDDDPGDGGPGDGLGDEGQRDGGPGDGGPAGGAPDGRGDGGSAPGGGPGSASGRRGGSGPVLAALVNITVPYTLWHGDTGPPGEIGGFGILDHPDTREAVAAAARSPYSRWCVTLLDPDGTAAAHGCAPAPRRWPTGPPGSLTPQQLTGALRIKNLDPVIRGACDHGQEEDRYRPSRRLQHLIRARNATCTAPGCGWRAAACDLDHTDPYDQGGKSCPCNLAPLCRRHHRCKQAEGWSLEQAEPGVLIWHTPSGRHYTTTPTQYAT